jgi:hypothetical protein
MLHIWRINSTDLFSLAGLGFFQPAKKQKPPSNVSLEDWKERQTFYPMTMNDSPRSHSSVLFEFSGLRGRGF